MLPAPQHAPSAYNWLPGNIHDLNMIRKVVPCCIKITTLAYPIAVDISSLQKCAWIHYFPDRHGWASFALPFCQFAGFEIPRPFRCQKRDWISVDANIAPESRKECGGKESSIRFLSKLMQIGGVSATARRWSWRENGRSGQSPIQDGIHAHNQVLKMANWGDQDPCTGHAALN